MFSNPQEVLENILPKLGVCCRRAIFEADPSVAKAFFGTAGRRLIETIVSSDYLKYITDDKALAVLGEDSDYMVFGVDYVSLSSLSWESENSDMFGNLFSAQSIS
jgi:hypothetical protein